MECIKRTQIKYKIKMKWRNENSFSQKRRTNGKNWISSENGILIWLWCTGQGNFEQNIIAFKIICALQYSILH